MQPAKIAEATALDLLLPLPPLLLLRFIVLQWYCWHMVCCLFVVLDVITLIMNYLCMLGGDTIHHTMMRFCKHALRVLCS